MKHKVILILFWGMVNFVHAQNHTNIKNYALEMVIDYEQKKLYANCELSLSYEGEKELTEIPFVLYRLLKVTSVSINGQNIPFKQEIRSFEDWDVFQVNFVQIFLPETISYTKKLRLSIEYEGSLRGYSETELTYVRDKIDEDFTIIRPECLPYPILGTPKFSTLKNISAGNFTYHLKITVPDSLNVVNGGALIDSVSTNGLTTYEYKSVKPTYQIVATIAKYQSIEHRGISTFYFENDSEEALKVHEEMLVAFELYSKWWGKLDRSNNFLLIEIPENYGSQATENYIIQTASAFNEPNQIRQLYHEISHLWNVKSTDKNPPRWNEGLATFIEYLTIEKLKNRNVLDSVTNEYYQSIKSDNKYKEIALIDYGINNVTGRSYQVGFVAFYILYQIIGDDEFHYGIKSYYDKYCLTGSTTQEFVQHFNLRTKGNTEEFFNDWFFSTDFFKYLEEGLTLNELIQKYASK